jgi:hypothetical protein
VTAPDLTQKIVGYRSWDVDAMDRLMSTGFGSLRWIPGPQRAACRARSSDGVFLPADHEAPSSDCDCGFYALHSLASARAYGAAAAGTRRVTGLITAWGRIEVHGVGFRAEWAEVVAIAPSNDWLRYEGAAARVKSRSVAEDYGADYVASDLALEYVVSRHGSPVPEAMRPKDPHGELATALHQVSISVNVTMKEVGKSFAQAVAAMERMAKAIDKKKPTALIGERGPELVTLPTDSSVRRNR